MLNCHSLILSDVFSVSADSAFILVHLPAIYLICQNIYFSSSLAPDGAVVQTGQRIAPGYKGHVRSADGCSAAWKHSQATRTQIPGTSGKSCGKNKN